MASSAITTNLTPFTAGHYLLPDGEGGEVVLVVVKATLDVDEQGTVAIAEAGAEICLVDETWAEPGRSSPCRDSDLIVGKPRVDVLVVGGQAHAPFDRPTEQLMVELHVGAQTKRMLVTGDRVWIDGEPSVPEPFVTMPLGWERAYGGAVSREQVDERNPLGIGYRGARSADPEVASLLPNLEDPSTPMLDPQSVCAPIGFGGVGRAWLPRRPLAGTFDLAWKRERWPLAPRDFELGFHQSAPVDQQFADLEGEWIRLVNFGGPAGPRPNSEWLFRLPQLDVPVHFVHADRIGSFASRCGSIRSRSIRRRAKWS